MRIALCAGHHPLRKGAVNQKYDLNEYDEACKIVTICARDLTAKGHQVEVLTGTLSEKIAKVNKGGFDLALDLHFNADADHLDPEDLDNSRGHGCMVMYCPESSVYGAPESLTYKRKTQADDLSLVMSSYIGNRNLGGRQGWYWGTVDSKGNPTSRDGFLTKTNCAAFIPEFGYIDNNGFAEKFLINGKHWLLAEALVLAVEALEV